MTAELFLASWALRSVVLSWGGGGIPQDGEAAQRLCYVFAWIVGEGPVFS